MSTQDSEERERQFRAWLEAFRAGSTSSLGKLLETCRNYLLLIANQSLDENLRPKVGPSDLVQETFLRAQNHWPDFQGDSDEELLAWLRQILLNQVNDTRRKFDAEKRQVDREVAVNQSQLEDMSAGTDTPSAQAVAAEQRAALDQAMARLPEDYRQVVVLRNWERRSFEEIGAIMGRSAEAARKLWARAIEKLQLLLGEINQ
jgi:RNA polymerase sigma-70 factor (ECF subfamily)